MYGNRSQRQIDAAKAGLWVIQDRQQLKELHNQEFGSCRNCIYDDIIDSWQCKECMNGGGSLKLFKEKVKKRRSRAGR